MTSSLALCWPLYTGSCESHNRGEVGDLCVPSLHCAIHYLLVEEEFTPILVCFIDKHTSPSLIRRFLSRPPCPIHSSPNRPHESYLAIHPPELMVPHFASSSFSITRATMGCKVVEVQDTNGLPGTPAPSTPFIHVLPSYSVTDEILKPPSAFPTTRLPPSAAIKIA
jgi:hypothetical protein